jgi:hypothetical protein
MCHYMRNRITWAVGPEAYVCYSLLRETGVYYFLSGMDAGHVRSPHVS